MRPGKIAVLAAAVLALSSCGGGGSSNEDITVGMLASFTGPLAQPSAEMRQGVELAIEEAADDDRLDGRKVTLVVEDDQSEPSVALRKGQKLATQDGASSIVGIASSAVGAAVAPQFEDWGAVGMIVGAKATSLTGPDVSDNLFREARSDAQDIEVIKQWVDKSSDLQRWSVIGADYNWGRDNAKAAKGLLDGAGREVISEEYVATGTTDFGPQINKIAAAKPDAVWVALSGQDAIAFLKQAADFGLSDSVPLVGVLLLSDSFVTAAGDAAVGAAGNVQYDVAADNEMNQDFVAAYNEKFGEAPTNYSFDGYLGMRLLLEGYATSDSDEVKDLIKAIEKVKLTTAIGEVSMDARTHQLQTGGMIGRVVDGPRIDVFSSVALGDIPESQ